MEADSCPGRLEHPVDVEDGLVGDSQELVLFDARGLHPVDLDEDVLHQGIRAVARKVLHEPEALVPVHLPAIEQPVPVGVRIVGSGAEGPFLLVGEAVPVTVRPSLRGVAAAIDVEPHRVAELVDAQDFSQTHVLRRPRAGAHACQN